MSVDLAFEHQVRECAALFRLGRDVEAALRMVEIFDGLIKALVGCPPDVARQCPVVLNALLQAQERQDWLGLADTLEVDLLQLLAQEEA
ncbi:MAG: hypothetical protein ACRYF9_03965 [Janthinobacterium lividum]|uniref:hypothetical protein n=1 Tax=Pseudomonas TaxID=286 RepID=UPI001CFA68A0|nr:MULTISPECIES: hypothetical protein [Pseudomonas]